MVCNYCLGNRLTNGVNLRSVSSSFDTNADIDTAERLLSRNKDGLVDFETKDLRLQKAKGRSIDVNEAATLLCVGDRSGGL